jgi:hypothetical protein
VSKQLSHAILGIGVTKLPGVWRIFVLAVLASSFSAILVTVISRSMAVDMGIVNSRAGSDSSPYLPVYLNPNYVLPNHVDLNGAWAWGDREACRHRVSELTARAGNSGRARSKISTREHWRYRL